MGFGKVADSANSLEQSRAPVLPNQAQSYRFDTFVVDSAAHELRRQGVRVRLQEQPYQVLLLLLDRAGKVVTREELRQRIWPSSVFVDFDHGLNNAIARLREALGDAAVAPKFIETIPRVGYRFLETVMVIQAEADGALPISSHPDTPQQSSGPYSPSRNRQRALVVGVAAVLAIAVLIAAWRFYLQMDNHRAVDTTALAPSIAVLPFVTTSAVDEDEQFTDGLTEELVNKLAGIRGLRVVARTSSYRFKGTKESAASIAQALHVNHFLEGSVRRTGTHLRITAQLIDALSDQHVWSRTFDREVGDIFQVQEEIAFAVADALKVSLLDDDQARVLKRGTSDAEAYRLYLIAQAHLLGRTPAPDLNLAKRALDSAIERDPNFSAAYSGLARYYFRRAYSTLSDTEESARLGAAAAERAVRLDPASSEAVQERANFQFWRYRFRGDYEAYTAATRNMQQAIELDPSNGSAFDDFGDGILWQEPDLALGLFDRELQIDPGCTGAIVSIAVLLGGRGQLDAARKRCTELIERTPGVNACHMAIATLETYFGHFGAAVGHLQAIEKAFRGAARIQLWSAYMSMGDAADAQNWLDFGANPFEKFLSEAARFAMNGRYEQAYEVLQQGRNEFPQTRILDLPTAKFALLAGRSQPALGILKQRLPDLVSGVEPITARNLLPALDLATAQMNTGANDDARALLGRIATYLDGQNVPHLPMFAFQRARAYALAGDPGAALRALDRAYNEGLRTTWALDLRPQSMLYIDPIEADPAFNGMRDDPRFRKWFGRVATANARQLEQLRKVNADPGAVTKP